MKHTIVMFNPLTKKVTTSKVEKTLRANLAKGYIIVGKLEGYNASVKNINNEDDNPFYMEGSLPALIIKENLQ